MSIETLEKVRKLEQQSQRHLDKLEDEERKFKVYEEELMNDSHESLYYLNELTYFNLTKGDEVNLNQNIENMSRLMRELEGYFQEREEEFRSQKRKLEEQLAELYVEKKRLLLAEEEKKQKGNENGKG
ncbi:hypothetical protein [Streptococcus gallolyticus]|uniref:hypothetical protein n=1 Tax=Streptococcus gallolyticus TaxID=315405 RepID=UPI00088BC590|nr:hypothetical protein [Streptococcus gallolyticus]SDK38020.1 hypothetical protein SAMN04487842_0062 [Streptococcus gallolyticus]SDL87182.1 hypothetical protein SAMN04487841_0068 [Streptococcus gallolyticus]